MSPRAFLKTCYRIEIADSADSTHRSGGCSLFAEARCPTCEIPLLLLWELNCRDHRFPANAFGSLTRFPLFFCWGCVNDLCYQVCTTEELRIFANDRPHSGPHFPYEPYPEAFPERQLQLTTELPESIKRLAKRILDEGQNDSDDEDAEIWLPSDDDQELLTHYFGHSTTSPFDLFHHQLGGLPLNNAWEEEFRCPNPACHGTIKDRILGQRRHMKFLAGVLNDPHAGLPMVDPVSQETANEWNHYVSVQFHVCDCCYSVVACNRCD